MRLWRFFHCFLFFHRLRVVQVFDEQTRKVQCRRCGRYYAMSDRYEAFLEWEDDFEEFFQSTYGVSRTLK